MKTSGLNLETALTHLQKDPVMKGLIEKYDQPEFTQSNDVFSDLVEAIIGQQLSGKAAATIVARFKDLISSEGLDFLPADVFKLPDRKIRACGVSFAKCKYIKNLCQAIVTNQLNMAKLAELSESEVIEALTQVKGIGPWTAEMILIFSLNRSDVFSTSDLGLRTAVSKLYYVNRNDIKTIEAISLKWRPYRSIACRYLWNSLKEEKR
jgi:DNA-3-methyladenine glycosylase II